MLEKVEVPHSIVKAPRLARSSITGRPCLALRWLSWQKQCREPRFTLQDVGASFAVGAVGSVAYLHLLNKSIDGLGGTSELVPEVQPSLYHCATPFFSPGKVAQLNLLAKTSKRALRHGHGQQGHALLLCMCSGAGVTAHRRGPLAAACWLRMLEA